MTHNFLDSIHPPPPLPLPTSKWSDLLLHVAGEHALDIEGGQYGVDVHVVGVDDLLFVSGHDDAHGGTVQFESP